MTKRFFVEAGVLDGDDVLIEGALAHRMTTVLRMKPGDDVVLFDGSGVDARVRLEAVTPRRVTATIGSRDDGPAESRTRVRLYQSITKSDRFEWLVEKATELGVASITPLVAARAVVKTASGGNRAERWRRIAVEAAEQCGRSVVPATEAPLSFDDALASVEGLLLVPYEGAGDVAPSIQRVLTERIDELFAGGVVNILLGPEGGFEPAEVERARAAGAEIVTLGTRVLRSETAGLVALTLVMQALGELG